MHDKFNLLSINPAIVGHLYAGRQLKGKKITRKQIIKEEKKRLLQEKGLLEKRLHLITLFIKTSCLLIETLNRLKAKAEEIIDSKEVSYRFDRFSRHTDRAIAEEDIDTFLDILFDRLKIIKALIKDDIKLPVVVTMGIIEKEEIVLARLESEREKTLKAMGALWDKMMSRGFTISRFPFPCRT